MNAKEFNHQLVTLGACSEARKWAKGKSLAEVWEQCDRADWLLWLCGRMAGVEGWPTQQQIVLTACDCAELALPFVPPGELRPSQAIETARRWAQGKATRNEVIAARRDAADAAAAAYAAYAAAAYAAAAAAAAAADAADAAAAYAAYAAAAYAAAAAAHTEIGQKCLAIIRRQLRPAVLANEVQQ